jgi:hypothetical protein
MLLHVLKNPMRKTSPLTRSTLNPYLTIMLTLLATLSKTPQGLLFLSYHLTEVMNDIHGTLRGHWCVPFQLFNLLTVFFLASEYPTLPGISSLPTIQPPAQTQDA